MHPDISRKTACAAALVLPVLFLSCNRQAVEQKQPVVEQRDTDAAKAGGPVGTSGADAAPAQPAAAGVGTSAAAPSEPTATASDTAIERDPDAIKALEGMSNYLRTLKAFQV